MIEPLQSSSLEGFALAVQKHHLIVNIRCSPVALGSLAAAFAALLAAADARQVSVQPAESPDGPHRIVVDLVCDDEPYAWLANTLWWMAATVGEEPSIDLDDAADMGLVNEISNDNRNDWGVL